MIEPDHKARLRAMSHEKQQTWELSHGDMKAIRWALAEIDRLEKAESRRIVANLRAAADRYEKDGHPGDLGSVWGWRTIAEHLRSAADELDRAEIREQEHQS